MGLRIFGALAALVLLSYAIVRYRRGQLRRGELIAIFTVAAGLIVAAVAPDLLDPILAVLGFEAGQERRIIGLLVISNLFTLAVVFRGFVRDDQLSNEVGDLVDYMAYQRLAHEDPERITGSCAVVIPAYNEAENLSAVLAAMPRVVGNLPIVPIVIADGCTDATEQAARSLGALVIRRDLRRGSGAAVRLGYQAALRHRASVVVTIDGDGQHDPTEMTHLVEPIVAGEADIVRAPRTLGSFEPTTQPRKSGATLSAPLLSALGRTKI